jgi:hypothetical protein
VLNFGGEFSENAVRLLCSDRVSESQSLEFKQSLPSTSDKDKAEFLKDVCAFANAGGGTIIFGVIESDGSADRIKPITDENLDSAQRRLGQILDTGIEPRLRGLKFDSVEVDDGYVLRLEIAPSFGAPYRYHFNGHSKFVVRNNTHTSELTYVQIRQAFDQSSSLLAQARSDWQGRVEAIKEGDTWKPMEPHPLAVVRLTPFASISGDVGIDVRKIHDDFGGFLFPDWWGGSRTFNLDGLVVYPGSSEPISAYTQIYRSGMLETIRNIGFEWEEKLIIPSTELSKFVRSAIIKFCAKSKDHGIYGPATINVALLNAKGYRFGVSGNSRSPNLFSLDRSNIILPEVMIEQIADFENYDEISKPLLDILWQAFTINRCLDYDGEGNWKPRDS